MEKEVRFSTYNKEVDSERLLKKRGGI